MDPLTAVGLATNILTFVDFGFKIVAAASDIHGSSSGSTEENRSSEVLATELKRLASRLKPPDDTNLTESETSLCLLTNECDNLAVHMIELLEKIKPRDHSKFSSFRAGLKSRLYMGDIKRVEERLVQCRAQLNLQLNYITSSESKARLEKLVSNARENSDKLDQLQNQIKAIHHGSAFQSLNPTSNPQLKALFDFSERASDLIAQHRILESLAFDGMYGRYEAVAHAHFETFRWIYDDLIAFDVNSESDETDSEYSEGLSIPDVDDTASFVPQAAESREQVLEEAKAELGENSEQETSQNTAENSDEDSDPITSNCYDDGVKSRAKKALVNWLRNGEGIFHISGKLGSGKSTLMKYLYNEEHTESLLQQWAGDRKLVFKSFFFWKPGSTLQNSLTGLLRSLAHDVLEACPELIQEAFPKQWSLVKSTPWQGRSKIRFDDGDIRAGFYKLLSEQGVNKNHCFCFWVDGLDEYEGTYQDDQKALIDMLCNWTKETTAVKLCVSSREYNVFMNALSANHRIRLHEITRTDMTNYVSSKLEHLCDKQKRSILIDCVVENADGIFLWVAIVVRRIRERFEDGSNVEALLEEVKSLPKELDALFMHILDSLAPEDLERAYRTFSMLMILNKYSWARLTLLAYSFLDEYMADPNFAIDGSLKEVLFSQEERQEKETLTRKRLHGCCKGLAEVTNNRFAGNEATLAVTHRSIPEFFAQQWRKKQMLTLLEDFNPVDAISQLALAELLVDPGVVKKQHRCGLLSCLVYIRSHNDLDSEPYLFLESLSEALARSKSIEEPNHSDIGGRKLVHIPNFTLGDGVWITVGGLHRADPKFMLAASDPHDPIYNAAMHGRLGYVKWKLRTFRVDLEVISLELLLFCLSILSEDSDLVDLEDVIEILIKDEYLGLNKISQIKMGWFDIEELDPQTQQPTNACSLTTWCWLIVFRYIYDVFGFKSSPRSWGLVIAKYLEYGVDAEFQIRVEKDSRDSMLDTAAIEESNSDPLVSKGQAWNSQPTASSAYGEGNTCQLKLIVGKEKKEILISVGLTGSAKSWMELNFYDVFSISSFIKTVGCENESRLLELVQRSTGTTDGIKDGYNTMILNNSERDETKGAIVQNREQKEEDAVLDNDQNVKLTVVSQAASTFGQRGAFLSIFIAILIYWVPDFSNST